MKTGSLALAALAVLSFAISSGCNQSNAAPPPGSQPGAGAESTPVGRGPRAEGDAWVAEMKAGGPYKATEQGTVEITVAPKAGYHINAQYPYKFKGLDPAPDGITYPKPIMKREDGTFDDKKGTFKFPFVAAKAGKAKVIGTLHLSVCSDANCVMEKQELEVEVDVK
jgi:hypothetical protein